MAKYINIEELWKCETCFYMRNGKCQSKWCDAGEDYRPAYSKFTIIEAELVSENDKIGG